MFTIGQAAIKCDTKISRVVFMLDLFSLAGNLELYFSQTVVKVKSRYSSFFFAVFKSKRQ